MVATPSMGAGPAQNAAAAKTAPKSRMNGTVPTVQPPTIPYSARRCAPLDMNTVERKSHPSARDPPVRNRHFDLKEAPTYRPTEEQWKDPFEYVKSIYEEASKYGICKIDPPESWNPDFAIDLSRFHFRTRRQELNSVEGGTRANLNYLDTLAKFHQQYGTSLNRFPSVDKRPLDLYKLKKAVEVRGGFEKVCKDKKWAEIGRDLGYSGKIMSSLSTSLKNSYQRWLHPYEEYLRTAKPGVQQQLEQENGGPYMASPAYSPPKVTYSQHSTPAGMMNHSPAMQASVALNSSLTPQDVPILPAPAPTPAPPVQSPPPAPALQSGFTAVNSGGFAAVNVPSSFVAVNHAPPQPVTKQEGENSSTPPTHNGQYSIVPPEMPLSTLYNFGPPPNMLLTNGAAAGSNPMKRTMSHDSFNGDSGSDGLHGDDESASGRRSKRARRDVQQSNGESQMTFPPTIPRVRSKSATRRTGEKCEHCGSTEEKDNVLVCESCELGFHRWCLDPPLQAWPDYDWHCPKCLVGTGEYGFEEGGIYSLKHFQEKANNFKEFHFQNRMPFDPVTNQRKQPSEDDIEREFWRLVETINETVEVEYGADIHSTTHGSGFPTIEKNPLNKYSKDPWNLNILPFHEESLFRHIKTDISGMTVPWLYVGMCFSTFCWHNEDHYTYSANYQHFGATKTWYGIPGKDAQRFEEAMRKAVPELFEQQPDLLFQLVTLLPPNQLRQAGVDVYALDQRAGQFVITFPQAYHAGFNHGFNFNEAVNFAPSDWEPFGETGTERLQEFRKQPCFSHDELLLTAAAVDSTIKTAKWLAPALERMRDRELHLREQLLKRHQELLPHENCFWNTDYNPEHETPCKLKHVIEDVDLTEDEVQCFHCKAYTFLTQFRCQHTGKVSCLLHTEITDCCAESPQERLLGPNHLLRYRHDNQELVGLVQKVVDKAAVPEAWQAKLNNLLEDEPRPPLKSLHSLLAEGEKIPYNLPGLEDLANFVRNCDRWVEEANLYLTRKQTNRRKNEKAWRRQSTKGTKLEEKEVEPELTIERMVALIDEGETLGFQCAQLDNLSEKVTNVNEWRREAQTILLNPVAATAEQIEGLLETGRSFMAAMPELTDLEALHEKQKWLEDAQHAKSDMQTLSLEGCKAMLKRSQELNFPQDHHQVVFFSDMARQGDFWEVKAKEVMSAETMHYPQLESLHAQTQTHAFPVNPETLAQMDAILTKNREAHRQIVKLYEQSRDPDFRKRPVYTIIREVMKTLEDLNSKPQGTIDLERELRRHEDWMRKGKKLFGKANAPLHILEQHMKFVEDRNNFCFDLNDTFRPPVEPASREASPMDDVEKGVLGEDEKPVFCICRQNEGGMMIMCEVCREWYHSKCLKIARGKMKEVDDFTCPICDWRVKIPRDAARPKLEELIGWKEEMPNLPFQPEEEDILNRIIDKAQAFRDFMQQFTNANQICRGQEEMSSMLFYLRKLEGAEVLLSHETNLFRQECYNYNPIAPHAPPILDQSLSTRKPRPTKQQKLLKEHGVEKVEDLPEHLRAKAMTKRKSTTDGVPKAPLIQPARMQRGEGGSVQGQARSDTPLGMPRLASTGNAPVNGQNGNHLPMSMAQSPHFTQTFATAGSSSYPTSTPSPMFSPTISIPANGLRDPAIASHFSGPSALGQSPTTHHDSYPLFTPGFSIDADDDIRVGLANANGSTAERDEPEPMSSPHATHDDDMFNMMTRSSPERGDQDTQNDEPPPLDEQATEALEMIKKASEESREASRGGAGAADEEVADDEDAEKAVFEDFF